MNIALIWTTVAYCVTLVTLAVLAAYGTNQGWEHVGWIWALLVLTIVFTQPSISDKRKEEDES